MAINTTTIIGDVFLPSGAVREKSYVIFEMTGFDTDAPDGATVVPYPIRAAISAGGAISQALWPNADGVRATFYRVTFEIYNGTSAVLVDGGQIVVPASGGPYVLNDLLPVAPPADADVDDYIAYLAAAVGTATTAASTASAAASSASASASIATTKAAEASASAALIGSALLAPNNLSDVASKPKSLATLRGFTSTVTSAGTTTLTAASIATQRFTGTTTQTVVLPDTTTLIAGWVYEIVNAATGALTVNSSGGNIVATVAAGSTAFVRCILASGTTAASWSVMLATGSASNLVVNPTGAVNQRGYVSGTATVSANQFTLDRWFVLVSGQSLTFTGTDAGRVMTAPAGGVAQVFDGRNIAGGTYVMSWTGAATLTVNGTARARGEAFTLPANTNAKIVFYGGTYTDVKCEVGAVPTAFAATDYNAELHRCLWYYQVIPLHFGEVGYANFAGTGYNFRRPLARNMRATPSVLVSFSSTLNATVSASSPSPYNVLYALTNTAQGNWSAFSNNLVADAEITA